MKKIRLMMWFLLLSLGLVPSLQAQEKEETQLFVDGITTQSEIYRDYRGNIVGTNGVAVRFGPTVLVANAVNIDENTGAVQAQGNISIQRENYLWRGEQVQYNLRSREIITGPFRAGFPPFFTGGDELASAPGEGTNRVYSAKNGYFTTDDIQNPSYRLRAEKLRIIPGQSLVAHNATLYLGHLPIFYFPYLHRRLDGIPNNFTFTPGYRSAYGGFLRSAYNWSLNDYLSGAIHLDGFQKRGVGIGPEIRYNAGEFGQGTLGGYYIHDLEPGSDPAGAPIKDDRNRITFSHRATLRTNLTATVVVNEQSDPYVVRDFFESQYRKNPQPKSFLDVDQLGPTGAWIC